MKLFLLSICISINLFAFTGEIKKDSVKLQINQNISTYSNGKILTLKAGDVICFVEGNGRVILKGNNYKKQLSKRSRSCKQLPLTKEASKSSSYIETAEKSIVTFFANAKEDEVSGVSRKSTIQETSTQKVLLISTQNQFISIESSEWGPLPIRLEIFDADGVLKDTLENEDEVMTSFILPVSRVEEGYILKVTNAFEDILVDVLVKRNKEEVVK